MKNGGEGMKKKNKKKRDKDGEGKFEESKGTKENHEVNQMSMEPNSFDIYKQLHRAKENSEEYNTLEVAKIAEEYERRMAE